MNEKEVETFMMTYQRITQNMFKICQNMRQLFLI